MKEQKLLYAILILSLIYLIVCIYSCSKNDDKNEKYTQIPQIPTASHWGGAYFMNVPKDLATTGIFQGKYGAAGYYKNVPGIVSDDNTNINITMTNDKISQKNCFNSMSSL